MAQTDRQALNAILHYENFDRVPVLHFGFWVETLDKWVSEGHLTQEEVSDLIVKGNMADGNAYELAIAKKLGFDDNALVYTGQRGNWYDVPLFPAFEEKILERFEDGSYKKIDLDGVLVKGREGASAIPAEFGHTLTDRASWEKEYLPRLQWTPDRLDMEEISQLVAGNDTRTRHLAVYAGSLFGKLRNYLGLVEISYLQMDDPGLFKECIDTIAGLSLDIVSHTLETGVQVDFAHFWEDICFNKGPLVQPDVFREYVGPHYRRIADECAKYGVDIVSLDCDGFVEDLVPIWLDNGVNTMFPIEVGAWEYDFSTMRKKFGKELRGMGNMKKHVLAESREAIDAEVERLKRLVDLGGFVPCPDHRIAPDAEWDLVLYYTEKMRKAFGW
ncbi:MAG: uroporphyrinogen decarboxylase family protein [Clostridiales Family XIII bacterium]|jgi:uroporphyrinogen decarboxylase|nr:uroporphyrinogen decarboxylase family protein [Clostridiales Family XIII bacterium]